MTTVIAIQVIVFLLLVIGANLWTRRLRARIAELKVENERLYNRACELSADLAILRDRIKLMTRDIEEQLTIRQARRARAR